MVSSGGLALVLCYLLFGASDCRLEHVFPLPFMEAQVKQPTRLLVASAALHHEYGQGKGLLPIICVILGWLCLVG